MKIVSVNSKQTVDSNEVAFNVDGTLTPALLERLDYGTLTFRGERNVLIVTLDSDDAEPIGADTVKSLNAKLSEAEEALTRDAAKRDRMLSEIAKYAGLPLD